MAIGNEQTKGHRSPRLSFDALLDRAKAKAPGAQSCQHRRRRCRYGLLGPRCGASHYRRDALQSLWWATPDLAGISVGKLQLDVNHLSLVLRIKLEAAFLEHFQHGDVLRENLCDQLL